MRVINLAACGGAFSAGLTRFFSVFILNILSKKWKFLYFQVIQPNQLNQPNHLMSSSLSRLAMSRS